MAEKELQMFNIRESNIKVLHDLKRDYQTNYSHTILNMTKAILIEIDKELNKDKKD